jgi:hypothetical protein
MDIKKSENELEIDLNLIIKRNPDMDASDLDGEIVMMNLEKGQYYMMNEVGSRIWELISEPKTVKTIINALVKEFQVETEECERDVLEFLKKLKYSNIISAN